MRAGKVGTNSIYPLGTLHAERWRTPIRSSDKGLSPWTAPHTAPKNAVDRELFDHPMAYRGGHGDRGRLSLVKLGLSRLVGGSVGVYAHHRTGAAPDGLSPLETANARWNFDVLRFNGIVNSPKKGASGLARREFGRISL